MDHRPRATVDLAELFQRGLADHRAGRLQSAEAVYREVLTADPAHRDALHHLGLVAHQGGRNDLAVDYIQRSLGLDQQQPNAHYNLGVVLRELGRLEDAATSYRAALNLRPDYTGAHNNLGNVLRDLGRAAEAAESYRAAVRCEPHYPEAHHNLGLVLCQLNRPAEAETSFRAVLRLWPDHAETHNNLGNVLRDLDRMAEAEAAYRAALRLDPAHVAAYINLGAVLNTVDRPAEAEQCCRTALRLQPDHAEAHNILGNVLRTLGRLTEAEAAYREALRLDPAYPEAHYNLATALLSLGRFEAGWQEYEWRWQTSHAVWAPRRFSAPPWRGEALRDRTILLHAEQGLGDTLQFCRYVPLMPADARIVLEVQPPLVRLLSRLPGASSVVARGETLPPFDLHCPLLSLPHRFNTTLATVPAAVPYIAADPALAAAWRGRVGGLGGLVVGLAWASNNDPACDDSGQRNHRSRSMTIDDLAPLAGVTGVTFISLQKGAAATELQRATAGLTVLDWIAELGDFADTAALAANLDLVISVDTAVAHLAGALGKPVWLVNRFDAEWRWLQDRDDCPWYPAMQLFRQPASGDWNSTIRRVADALRSLAAGNREAAWAPTERRASRAP